MSIVHVTSQTKSAPRRNRLIIAIVICICAVVGGVVWSKRPGAYPSADASRQRVLAREAERALRQEALVSLSDASFEENMSSGIATSLARDGQAYVVGLGNAVSAFLAARYGPSGHDAYVKTMEKEGYVRRDIEELKSKWFIDEAYQVYIGEELPSEPNWDELAKRMFSEQDRHEGGRSRIVSVGSGEAGLSVVVKRLTKADPRWPRIGGLVGDALDAGQIAISSSWWRSPSDHYRLLAEGKEPLVASVGFIAEMGDGQRRPIALSLHLDESRQKWWVVSLWHGRLSQDDRAMLRFEY